LLKRHTPKGYRGFESLPHRVFSAWRDSHARKALGFEPSVQINGSIRSAAEKSAPADNSSLTGLSRASTVERVIVQYWVRETVERSGNRASLPMLAPLPIQEGCENPKGLPYRPAGEPNNLLQIPTFMLDV